MKVCIKIDDFSVIDEDGVVYQAVTIYEFERKKKGEHLIPRKEQSFCMLPIDSEEDDNYLSVEDRKTVRFSSKYGSFTKGIRPKK